MSISNFQSVLPTHSYLICDDLFELLKLPWVCIRLLESSSGADAVIRPGDVDMPIFVQDALVFPLCTELNPLKSYTHRPIEDAMVPPSQTVVPSVTSYTHRSIMSSNQQIHIGPGPSRPTPTDQTFHHCLMQLLVSYPMEGTRRSFTQFNY